MFDLEKAFGYDRNLAENGAKKMLGTDPEEYIILKRIPNPEYRSLLNKEYRTNELLLSSTDTKVANEASDAIFCRVLAQTAVVGWGKKLAVKGKVIPFSVENCVDLFMKYPEFRQSCQSWAENNANFQIPAEVSPEQVKKS